MATSFVTLGASLLQAMALSAAAGPLAVTFIHPENYTDAGYSRDSPSERERAVVQRDIEHHLQSLAARHLTEGDSLAIEVLDVDLAGRFEPFAARDDLRIVRDITWPRMTLRYTLTRNGAAQAPVEERLSDRSFLMSINRYPSGDRLRYEKAMLDDWFARRFGKP
jgi:hypothetical protein